MTSALALSTPGAKPVDLLINSRGPSKLTPTKEAKARSTAQDFEAVFLNSMFQNMFTGISGEGPFGGSGAVGVWRSMLTDEYSRSFAKGGGIGIADQVYRSLMARQEVQSCGALWKCRPRTVPAREFVEILAWTKALSRPYAANS